jgi:hypothetical protein
MKISAQFSMWACVVFALACFGVAFNGLSEVDAVDAAARATPAATPTSGCSSALSPPCAASSRGGS